MANEQSTSASRRNGDHLVGCPEEDYHTLLSEKVQTLRGLMGSFYKDDIEVFESPKSHFRMRANFNLWHDDPKKKEDPEGLHYIMFNEEKLPCEITAYPRGTELINKLMQDVLTEIKTNMSNFPGVFEVRIVTTSTNNAVIVLIHKRPLPSNWQQIADALSVKFNAKIVGRARKMKIIGGGTDVIEEILTVKDRQLKYYQTEGAFSQPNAKVCEKMLTWASDVTSGSHDNDLLELYCGGGTFTAALSYNFRKVLATEMSKASVELAHECFAANHIENIKIARLSSEEFSQAYTGKRSFSRLSEARIDFADYDIKTVLVDPPRAGVDADTCKLLCRFDKIVYISCNPETLARDVGIMSATHKIVRLAAFDQFPYTHHLECGCLLQKMSPEEAEVRRKEMELTGGGEVAVHGGGGAVLGKRTRDANDDDDGKDDE